MTRAATTPSGATGGHEPDQDTDGHRPADESQPEQAPPAPAAAPGPPEMPPEMKRSNVRFALALPLFLMVMFPLCYITALHQPVPHHLPVAVVGAAAAGFIAQVGPALAGQFDLVAVGSLPQATDMIVNQTVKAAYVPAPSGQPAQMLVAGADGRMITQLVPAVFRPIAAQFGHTLHVVDIAPLAPGDANGIGLMFFMLIVVLVGFMTANILGNAAFFLGLGTRLALCAGAAVLAPVVLWAFMGPWLQIIIGSPSQILAVLAIGAAASFTVALATTAAVVFLTKWALFPCMLIFIFLNIPSSNSAYPAELVPPFFGAVSHIHLGAATVGAIRSVLYLHGAALAGYLTTMAVWLAAALVLIAAAIAYRRRTTSTAPTTASDDEAAQQQPPGVPHAAPEALADSITDTVAEAVEAAEAAEAGTGPPGRALRGLVHDHRATPLLDAVITLIHPTGTQSGRARTDATGRFHIGDLDEGSYIVIASAVGYRPAAHSTLLGGHLLHPGEGTDELGAIQLARLDTTTGATTVPAT